MSYKATVSSVHLILLAVNNLKVLVKINYEVSHCVIFIILLLLDVSV
jgi:hypothetical protein